MVVLNGPRLVNGCGLIITPVDCLIVSNDRHGILFELTHVGAYVRVCAIDSRTGTEVTMVGDPAQSQETLKRLAARKLQYVMDKKQGG